MLYKGGTPILSLSQIQFLHHFLSNKPSSLLYPKTLFKTQKIEAKKHHILYIRTKTRFVYTATINQ